MRAINVLLSLLVVVIMFVLALEGGLRLLGKGPGKKINQPDAQIGWVKRPDFEVRRKSPEYDAILTTNALGLRDDPMESPAKPAGTYRVLCLGDSFTLGYTVDRRDLFVDQLERWWQAEGRKVELINAGTEGYSTDQAVAWYLAHGAEFQADLVMLFPYENDIYWSGQTDYLGTPKPRFDADGNLEADHVQHEDGLLENTAIGRTLKGQPKPATAEINGRQVLADFLPLLNERPEALGDAPERTVGAIKALKQAVAANSARLVMAPIPSHSAVDPGYASMFGEKALGLAPGSWSADRPVDFFLESAEKLGIPALDARTPLRAAQSAGEALYYERDFHLTPAGNRVFTAFLKTNLPDLPGLGFPAATDTLAEPPAAPEAPKRPAPFWPKLYAFLVLLLGAGYAKTYREQENPLMSFVKVAALLAVIFTIAIGGSHLIGSLPPNIGQVLLYAFILTIVGFIIYKLGRRTGTILELFGAFVGRGHWYLMPLVVVLLTIGSLLVVAASSPLVAPFIYTLF